MCSHHLMMRVLKPDLVQSITTKWNFNAVTNHVWPLQNEHNIRKINNVEHYKCHISRCDHYTKKGVWCFLFFCERLILFHFKTLVFASALQIKVSLVFFCFRIFKRSLCGRKSSYFTMGFWKKEACKLIYPFFFSEISSLFFSKGLSAFLSPSCHLDKRTDNWLLVYSPVPISCVFLCYLIIIWVGSKLMARRQPVNLRPVLIVYNFAMVCLSAYMFYEVNTILLEGTIGKDNGEREFRAAKRKSV